MKYGIIPSNILERLALWADKIPVPMVDVLFPLIKARVVMAAVKLKVFEALRDRPLTAGEVATTCQLDVECTTILLRILAYSDYLKQKGDKFHLTKMTRNYLLSGSKSEITGFIEWNYTQWEMIGNLEELIKTGKGLDFHQKMTNNAEWQTYQRAMLELAHFDASLVADKVPVKSGASRLLDIAGSHGLFGATICRKHPPMKSTVIDLPNAIEYARDLAKTEKIDDVVEHRVGDITKDSFGKDNDVVLLSNILHHFEEEMNQNIINRVYQSLSTQGTVAIWEIETPAATAQPDFGDAATILFRLTSNGRCYNGADYEKWLNKAGFQQIKINRPMLSPGSILVTGRV